jgi:RHS repeat-associated protein
LYLGVNDNYYPDNYGSWTVEVAAGEPIGGAITKAQGYGGGGGIAPGTCDCKAGDPIDIATGDYTDSATDASAATYGPPLIFTRTYDADMAQAEAASSTPGPLGYGWTDNWATSLLLSTDYDTTVSGDITLNQANGSQALFVPPVSGSCVAPYVGPGRTDTYCALPRVLGSLTYHSGSSTYTLVEHPSTTYTFNSSGQLTAIADPDGGTESITYESPSPGSGNCPEAASSCETVASASGRSLTLGWSASDDGGTITSVTDPAGRETTYTYGDGNLTSVTDPLSNVTSYTYDSSNSNADLRHELLTVTDPNEQSGGPDEGTDLANTYNTSGQVTSQTDAMDNVTSFNYDSMDSSTLTGTVVETDPDSIETQYTFSEGTLTDVTTDYDTDSAATTTYDVDPSTLLNDSVIDPDGNATSYTYDNDGNVLTSTNTLGDTTSYSYNALDDETCVAEPLSSSPCSELSSPSAITADTTTITPPGSAPLPYVTYSEYDTDGNLIYTTTGDYAPGSDTASQSRTTYDLYNGQSVTLDGVLDSCTHTAPSTELPCATINADGVITQLTYDSNGDLTSKSTTNENQGLSPGVINTVMGAPMGSVTATQTYQDDAQIATATIDGTSYAYVADAGDDVIRRINLATDVETVVAGDYDSADYGNGNPATSAEFGTVKGVAVDSAGDLAIADAGDNLVWFVPASSGTYFGQSMTSGGIYKVAGDGAAGSTGNGDLATSAKLDAPSSVAFDGSAIVVADTGSNEVRIVPDSSGTYFGQSMTAGDIYAVAGTGTVGYSGDGGAASAAELDAPDSVAVDAAGDLVVADTDDNVVRFVPDSSGTYFGASMTADDIYTVAGTGTAGYSGDSGAATSAELSSPGGVSFDGTDGVVIADTDNYAVRFVPFSSGTYFGQSMTANDIYTVAGDGDAGISGNGGTATSAHIDQVADAAVDANGDLLLSAASDSVARIVAASSGALAGQTVTAGDIYSLAGTGNDSIQNYTGPAVDGQLNSPTQVDVDAAGDVLTTDSNDNVVRFIPKHSGSYYGQSMTANDVYTVAGDGTAGYAGDGGLATSAELDAPDGAAVDANGDIAIGDRGNNEVRFIPKASGTYFGQSMTANDIYTITGDDGPVAFDAAGDLYIVDTVVNIIRFIPVSSGTYYGQTMTADDVYTIVGNGTAGYSGDGSAATSAEIYWPESVAVDAAGDLLIADSQNNVVRFVPSASGTYYGQAMTANDIYTVAGNGTAAYSGDGGAATSAELDNVTGAAFDSAGNLLIADSQNDVVRFVPRTSGEFYGMAMTANDIYTVAGAGWGDSHTGGDGGPPLDAEFAWISSVAGDGESGFYIADRNGNRVRYVSDAAPTSVSTTTYTYDADGEMTRTTTPNGNVAGANAANFTTTYTYNDDGEVTAATQGGGEGATVTARTTGYTYDGDGNETSVTDPRDHATDYAYNADDEQTLVTNADSDATLTCYDGDGNVAETVPAVGVAANSLTAASCPTNYPTDYGDRLATDATTYAYNALGEKTTVTSPAPPGLSGYETTTDAYNLDGWLTSVTAPPTSTTGGAPNDVTEYTYDDIGDLLTTTTGYDTATASTTSSCYDPDGNVAATVSGDGNVSSVASCSTSSPYQTASDYQTAYTYDSLGELLTQTAPETTAAPDGQVTTYAYDPAGNELTVENPDGVTATSTYSPLNQLLSVSYSDDTADVAYSYDANGNETGMSDASGVTSSTYDPFNELTSTTNGAGDTTSYSYDLDGNVTGITYPLGSGATWASTDTVAYAYDDADELASVTDFNGHTSDVTNTADELPSELTLGASGDTITTAYGANDEPTSITLGDGSTLQKFAYSDAPSGGVASETDTPSSALSPADYTYDAQSQVIGDTPGTDTALSYTQDASANLTMLPTGASGSYDDASELTSSAMSATTTDYTYDASGNRTAESGGATMSATYNGASELTSYDNAAADTSSAYYDGNGLRTSATSTPSGGSETTQQFVWNTTTSVPELLMDSTRAYFYGPDGTPFEQVTLSSGAIRYLSSDALGSVRGVVSSGGSLTASTSYDAWGNPETTGGLGSYTPFGFAGGYTDPTGLLYFINRYYDPTTGQFMNVDPEVAATGQPYAYAGDDPVDAVDPFGLSWYDPSWLPSVGNDVLNGAAGAFSPIAKAASWYYKKIGDQQISQELQYATETTGCTYADEEAYKIGTALGALAGASVPFLGEGGDALDLPDGEWQASGSADSTEAEDDITFGHGARHLQGTALSATEVQQVITNQVQDAVASSSFSTGSFWGRVEVQGISVEYRAYTLPNGTINVGTYYVTK